MLDSEIMQLIPANYAREMVATLMNNMTTSGDAVVDNLTTEPSKFTKSSMVVRPKWKLLTVLFSEKPGIRCQYAHEAVHSPRLEENRNGIKNGHVPVRPVQFAGLDETEHHQEVRNIDIILDVPLDISVELGKTKRALKKYWNWVSGSIVSWTGWLVSPSTCWLTAS